MIVVPGSEREARHQVDVRATNELASHVALRPDTTGSDPLVVRCECGDPRCPVTVRTTRAGYEAVRALGSRFIVADTHENPEISVVVAMSAAYTVVDTVGRSARRTVLAADPRAPPAPTTAGVTTPL